MDETTKCLVCEEHGTCSCPAKSEETTLETPVSEDSSEESPAPEVSTEETPAQ